MFATTILTPAMLRISSVITVAVRRLLMAVGLISLIFCAGILFGHEDFLDGLKSLLPTAEAVAAESVTVAVDVGAAEEPPPPGSELSRPMRQALGYVSRRYRVSTEALVPIFETAQHSGRQLGLDPLLIVAVIGIESGFNPFSQSVFGAQGLMQVIPRFHGDKVPEDAGDKPFIDPVTNVQIGARVLKESIARSGGVVDGLQQFGGASNDPEKRYSSKVLGEHQRLQAVAQLASKA